MDIEEETVYIHPELVICIVSIIVSGAGLFIADVIGSM